MNTKEAFHRRELDFAEESFSSAASLELVSKCIDFPEDVRGLTILDICAGASSAVLGLQKRGAMAVAVDYRYQDVDEVYKSVRKYLAGETKFAQKNKKVKSMEDQAANLFEGTPLEAVMQLYIRNRNLGTEIYNRETKKNLNKFMGMYKSMNLVAGIAGELPFKDETFDFCFSEQGITPFLLNDRDLMIRSVAEVLRVLKSGNGLQIGGQFQIHSWNAESGDDKEKQIANAAEILQYLENEHIPYFIEPTTGNHPRLRIVKP